VQLFFYSKSVIVLQRSRIR